MTVSVVYPLYSHRFDILLHTETVLQRIHTQGVVQQSQQLYSLFTIL